MGNEDDKNVANWYDEFSAIQEEEGINLRNEKIQEWLVHFGLKEDSTILEIGCGIGTQTQLLAEYLKQGGSILANDISEKSIQIAKRRLNQYKNIEFIAGDIVKTTVKGKFDIILLPDVLEHIPIKDHHALFQKIRSLINDNGIVIIHIPNPNYLEWCHKNKPEVLQVIDQPIHTDILVKNTYSNDLYIDYLETYSIWVDHNDYQIITLKPNVKKDYKIVSKKKTFVDKLRYKAKKLKAK